MTGVTGVPWLRSRRGLLERQPPQEGNGTCARADEDVLDEISIGEEHQKSPTFAASILVCLPASTERCRQQALTQADNCEACQEGRHPFWRSPDDGIRTAGWPVSAAGPAHRRTVGPPWPSITFPLRHSHVAHMHWIGPPDWHACWCACACSGALTSRRKRKERIGVQVCCRRNERP